MRRLLVITLLLLATASTNVVAAGHGQPISGAETARQLKEYAYQFEPPRKGRYVDDPAIADESGVIALPPPVTDNVKIAAAAVAAGLIVTALMRRNNRKND